MTDSERVVAVLENVISKAVQLSRRQGQVAIDLWTEEKGRQSLLTCSVCFSVDKSMSEEQQLEIFDAGKRSSSSLYVS